MPGIERGCLLIADIGGFTEYVGGVELDHASDVLASLLQLVVDQTRGSFELSNLEGDAVFAHASGASISGGTVHDAGGRWVPRTRISKPLASRHPGYSGHGHSTPIALATVLSFMTSRRGLSGTGTKSWRW